MKDSEILELFRKTDALLEGHFKLSSGRHADTYIQCAKVLQYPEYARILGRELAARIPASDRISAVIAPAMGGLIIGHEVAAALGVRFIFSERQDGVMTLRRGFVLEPGERVVLIEDVITTGKSTREVVDLVEHRQGTVAGLGCLANRSTTPLDLPLDPAMLLRLSFENWQPEECPLCLRGMEIESPGSRFRR
ncbi:MAG TPA: orotate phosphoribosyltransferase [bacterium]|nr:orotate phosphoribosyltransferase [bacterium]